jgi:hypothetical protein
MLKPHADQKKEEVLIVKKKCLPELTVSGSGCLGGRVT